jgi:hypothetical protein
MSATLDKIIEEVRALSPEEQQQLREMLEHETHRSEQSRRAELMRLAEEQGVKPFNFDDARRDFWPEEESADEFLIWIRSVRDEGGAPRSLPE